MDGGGQIAVARTARTREAGEMIRRQRLSLDSGRDVGPAHPKSLSSNSAISLWLLKSAQERR
jgi:hypothetical protein